MRQELKQTWQEVNVQGADTKGVQGMQMKIEYANQKLEKLEAEMVELEEFIEDLVDEVMEWT